MVNIRYMIYLKNGNNEYGEAAPPDRGSRDLPGCANNLADRLYFRRFKMETTKAEQEYNGDNDLYSNGYFNHSYLTSPAE